MEDEGFITEILVFLHCHPFSAACAGKQVYYFTKCTVKKKKKRLNEDYIFILNYGRSGRKQWGGEGSSIMFTLVNTRGRQAGPDLILLTTRSLQGCSYTICHKEEKNRSFFISSQPSALPPFGSELQTKISEASCWLYF